MTPRPLIPQTQPQCGSPGGRSTGSAGHSQRPAPEAQPISPPPPARAAPNPRGSAPQPNTAPRPQRRPNPDVAPHRPQLHPGPERGGPAPNSLRQRRGAAQAESRGEGEQRGGESARPGAEPHPRSTAAAPTDFGPGPGADSALKAAAGRGLRATPVRGRDVGAAVWGEGNPGRL